MMSSPTNKISNFPFLHISSVKQENVKRMTRLCIIVLKSENVISRIETQVGNKIDLCFNPSNDIPPGDGEQSGSFSPSDVDNIKEFLRSFDEPICFVAHYGFGYDYSILHEELNRIGQTMENILCVDTTQFFRNHVKGKISEIWPLREIYKELTSIYPFFSHTAEGYVYCLMHCVSHFADDFVTWANYYATPFSSTPEVNN